MESLETGVLIALVIIMLINISLHTIGIYLLRCHQKNTGGDVQDVYIMNMNVVEIALNLFSLLLMLLHSVQLVNFAEKIVEYIYIIDHTVLNFTFYMNTVYLALNKLLNILLNLKYSVYWNIQKAKYLVFGTWIVGVVISVCIILSFELSEFDYEIFDMYFFIILDCLVLFVSISSYGYIFHKYKETRRLPFQGKHQPNQSIFYIFRKSKFYVCVLLILTFSVFVIIPDLIFECLNIYHANDNVQSLLFVIAFLYAISYSVDAIIYIYSFYQK